MKKLFYLAALAAIVAGCAKEPATPETDNVNEAEEVQLPEAELVSYSFSATLEAAVDDASEEGKATISDAGAFSWSAGDEIAVWNSTENAFVTFTCDAGDGNFTGTAAAGAVFTTAYYPASIAVAGNPGQVNLASSYSLAESTSGKFFPMVASVSGSNLAFTHLGSLLKITINDVPADATSLTLTSATAVLSGNFAVQSGQINAGSGAGSVSVSISHSAKENLAFYFPVPVGNYSYTITLGDGTTTMLTKSTTSDKPISRATFHALKALTVPAATTNYEIVGWFAYNGHDSGWSTEDGYRIPFEPSNIYGWLVAKNMGVRDNHVSFKLKTGGTWTGTTVDTSTWRKLGTGLTISSAGTGNDITVETNTATLLDIYYNPDAAMLFAVPAGQTVKSGTVPAPGGNADSYTLIGYHAADNWGADLYCEGVPGTTDWYAVRNIGTTGSNPHMDFKLRQNKTWGWRVGAIKYPGVTNGTWNKTANSLFDLKNDNTDSNMNNITFYGASGNYDFYFKGDFSQAFFLPNGSEFAIPSVHEASSHYSLIGLFNIDSVDYDWSADIEPELCEGTTNWLVVKNVNVNTTQNEYLQFKFRLDKAWTDGVASVGDYNKDKWRDVGNFYSANVSTDSQNIEFWAPANDCPVDIYLKSDLSQFGAFTHGTTPVFP